MSLKSLSCRYLEFNLCSGVSGVFLPLMLCSPIISSYIQSRSKRLSRLNYYVLIQLSHTNRVGQLQIIFFDTVRVHRWVIWEFSILLTVTIRHTTVSWNPKHFDFGSSEIIMDHQWSSVQKISVMKNIKRCL